mgnify:FL=1
MCIRVRILRPCKWIGAAALTIVLFVFLVWKRVYSLAANVFLRDPFAVAAFMAVRSVVRPNLCFLG